MVALFDLASILALLVATSSAFPGGSEASAVMAPDASSSRLVPLVPLVPAVPVVPAVRVAPEPSTTELHRALDSEWHGSIAPYVWMTALDGKVTARNLEGDVDVPFHEVLDSLDLALMVHVEAQRGATGLMFDALYADLSMDETVRNTRTEVGVEMAIAELGGFWRFHERVRPAAGGERQSSIDLLGGVRYTDLEAEVELSGPLIANSADQSADWFDPFVGLRFQHDWTDRLTVSVRGDVGGFDVGGASDFTWNAIALLGWRVGSRATLMAGYRSLDVDYDDGDFAYDVRTSGPLVGILFE